MNCHCAKNKNSTKCKFSVDTVSFIMYRFYADYGWEPAPELAEPIQNSPCTPAIKRALERIYLDGENEMHEAFEDALCDNLRNSFFGDVCDFVIQFSQVYKSPWNMDVFLKLCVLLSSYAACAFNRGADAAPVIAMSMMCQTIEKMVQQGLIVDESWEDLHMYCDVNYPKQAS